MFFCIFSSVIQSVLFPLLLLFSWEVFVSFLFQLINDSNQMRGCKPVNELHPSSQQLTMTTSSCICTEKKSPPSPESWDYPEWKDGADNIKVFQRNGYFVVRGLISEEEIEDTKSAITGIVQKWFQQLKSKDATEEKDWEEIANRLDKQ